MTVRAFTRARARRVERERRRAAVLVRRGRVVGAALGASAVFASAAQAATYTVTSSTDDTSPAACSGTSPNFSCNTLRDAVAAADSDTSTDTITFANTVTGAITLSSAGAMNLSNGNGITIAGPGAGTLAIDAHTASQIFTISNTSAGPGSIDQINGLTLENGSSSNPGGAVDVATSMPLTLTGDTIKNSTTTSPQGGGGVFASNGPLTVTGSTISGNTASAGDGGGLAASSGAALTLSGTTISVNTAQNGGGIGGTHTGGTKYAPADVLQISGNSHVTGNHATGTGSNGNGGGISGKFNTISIDGAVISGNDATNEGGGIVSKAQYAATIQNSTISQNSGAGGGGGVDVGASQTKYAPGYAPVTISRSTLSGNQSPAGAGVHVDFVNPGNTVALQASTLTGNHGGAGSFGGGVDIAGGVSGTFRLSDSTVTGNSAANGGGLSLGDSNHRSLTGSGGAIDLDNSTVSGNAASTRGGGIYLGEYASSSVEKSGTPNLRSTVVSGNGSQDLARAATSTSGGFNAQLSLIQNPGTAPFTSKQSVITGVDPKLGPLANNGGPTETMLPAGTSPVIDQGRAFDDVSTDQRGDPRIVDTPIPNPPGGDGTDIGAVELPASSVAGIGFNVLIDHAPLGGTRRLLIAGRGTAILCRVRLATISGCVVKVKVGNKLVATGSATTTRSKHQIFLRVKPTAEGFKLLKHHPLGIKATASALGVAPGSPTVSGPVRLLSGPVIKLPISNSGPLSKKLGHELDKIASLLTGVHKVHCKAPTKAQAKQACDRLKSAGLSAQFRASGGHKNELVIAFTYRV